MKDLIRKIFGPRGKKTTAGELAKKFGLELKGNAKEIVNGVAPIADAKPGQLAFYSTERNSAAFKILPIEVLKNTRATVILLQREQIKDAPKGATLLITDSPRGNIVKILSEIYAEKPRFGVSYFATVEKGVFILVNMRPLKKALCWKKVLKFILGLLLDVMWFWGQIPLYIVAHI